MKKAILPFTIFFFGCITKYAFAQTDSLNLPAFSFETTTVTDTVYIGSGVRAPAKNYVFHFTNTGKSALIITNMQSSDPCFACEYPKEPILPGKKSIIKVCCPELHGRTTNYHRIHSNAKESPMLKTDVVVIRR